ncbi:MAG: hypothetical protein MI723_06290, partial [Caulobacterales bacterium]|nr:hypothetical protein [Caulobacterales bacterium]
DAPPPRAARSPPPLIDDGSGTFDWPEHCAYTWETTVRDLEELRADLSALAAERCRYPYWWYVGYGVDGSSRAGEDAAFSFDAIDDVVASVSRRRQLSWSGAGVLRYAGDGSVGVRLSYTLEQPLGETR